MNLLKEVNPAKDQHILQNKEIIEREIEAAEITKEDNVIEIGAGPGNLTRAIATKAKSVLAFEIDQRFKKQLEKLPKNVEVMYANALKQKWRGWNKIVANIPYTHSEPIMWKAIQEEISLLVLIVGESFKEILCSKERKIGYLAQLFFIVEPVQYVGRFEFLPPPRTDSWMVRLRRKQQTAAEKIMGEICVSRQKTKNAMMYALVRQGRTKNEARKIIEKMRLEKNMLEEQARKLNPKTLIRIEKEMRK